MIHITRGHYVGARGGHQFGLQLFVALICKLLGIQIQTRYKIIENSLWHICIIFKHANELISIYLICMHV